jgi:hypothetical protein
MTSARAAVAPSGFAFLTSGRSDLITDVIAFVDPLLADDSGDLSHWDPAQLRWVLRRGQVA